MRSLVEDRVTAAGHPTHLSPGMAEAAAMFELSPAGADGQSGEQGSRAEEKNDEPQGKRLVATAALFVTNPLPVRQSVCFH
jgi:hypothetical protein